MITFGFFDSVDGDRKYSADQISQYFKGLIGDGIYENVGSGLVVTAGSGLSVNVGTGRGIVKYHWIENDNLTNIALTAHSSLPKYVAIVMRYDKSNRKMEFGTVDGTPASTPEKPTLSNTDLLKELALAYVLVPAGATSISASNIEDARSASGWVTGLITQLDISNLYQQWVALFNDYYQTMEEEFEEWFDMLTEQLNVSTYIRKFTKNVTLESGSVDNHIPLDMTNYTYNLNDVIKVYINGLYGVQGVDWSLNTSEDPVEIDTAVTADGTEVYIEILKSKVGFNILIGANNTPVVDENDNNIVLGGE